MNYFVEGLQGSGKSTLVRKLSEKYPDHKAICEGEYSPVELAWCAYVDKETYNGILKKYDDIRDEIVGKSFEEDDRMIICYTKIITDIPGFHKDLEQYEIYNNRLPFDMFQSIVLSRYKKWNSDRMIFECSLFQNIVEDMILFRQATDEEIMSFYRLIREALNGKEYRIVYLKAKDIRSNLETIRKERSEEQGNELWFPMIIRFFNDCPYAKTRNLKGEEDLISHFVHRQDLELRICKEIFLEKSVIIESKNYREKDIDF